MMALKALKYGLIRLKYDSEKEKMKMLKMNLRYFADFNEILTTNAQAFEGTTLKDSYGALTAKLGELGYDVLINNKKSAEFVPSSRLNDVVSQRDAFKVQVENANKQLEDLKKAAKNDPELTRQLEDMTKNNNALLAELEKSKINYAITVAAKDAVNPADIVAFINMDNVKLNSKGEVTGVEAEVERLRKEKAYLFNGDPKKRKAGSDLGGGKGAETFSMNDAIRRAAGRG
jgi:molybdopterin converting factor small subunit